MQFTIDSKALITAINSVKSAMSSDDTRYVINSIFIEWSNENATFVATDGRRLAKCTATLQSSNAPGNFTIHSAEIPTLLSHAKQSKTTTVTASESLLSFKFDEKPWQTTPLSGQYPNYRQVIPTTFNGSCKGNIANLRKSIELVSCISSDPDQSMKFTLTPDNLTVSATTKFLAQAEDFLPINLSGPPISFNLNGRFLQESLKSIANYDDTCEIQFFDELAPILIRGIQSKNAEHIIMPIRAS